MIICTNCNHENPEGSVQCENCYAPLPQTSPCPHCGAFVQTNATFCGQCGYNLQSEEPVAFADAIENSPDLVRSSDDRDLLEEDAIPTENVNSSLKSPWDTETGGERDFRLTSISALETAPQSSDSPNVAAEMSESSVTNADEIEEVENLEELIAPEEFDFDSNAENDSVEPIVDTDLDLALEEQLPEMSDIEELEATTAGLTSEISKIGAIVEPSPRENLAVNTPQLEPESAISEIAEPLMPTASESSAVEHPVFSSQPINPVSESATQLQLQRIILSHVQTGTDIEIAQNLDIIRIGKPNNQIPPDIDVSGFPDANIVSRVHANIRVEGDAFFIEDLGSSNGTYINHKPLLTGNRHRLRFGDRISLGKGDLMTFIFKIID